MTAPVTRIDNPVRPKIWLINPYGPLPNEGWRDYSFITFGKVLASSGFDVIWWTSNFSHHFKNFRSSGWEDISVCEAFVVRLVPTTGYKKNVSLARIVRDVVFAGRTWLRGRKEPRPDVIIANDNPLTLGFPSYELAKYHGCALVHDQLDLWPELLVRAMPRPLRPIIDKLLFPIYLKRRRYFRSLDGATALAQLYLESITRENDNPSLPTLLVYNGIDVNEFRQRMRATPRPEIVEAVRGGGVKAIFAGTLGPSYDIQCLIDAAEKLERDGVDATILVAGDGPMKSHLIEKAQGCARLKYIGRLGPEELPAVYASCDIGLSAYGAASNVEMPDKFYDYTAAGLAVVNSLRGEVSSHIAQNGIGRQYKAGCADSLFEMITFYVREPSLLADAKQRSWQIGEQFDRNAQHAPLASFVENVLRGKNVRRH